MKSQPAIDRALREWREELPENFAAQTAAFVEAQSRDASDRLESWLQRALILALIVSAVVAVLFVGGSALAALASFVGKEWIYSVAICLGLSLAIQLLVHKLAPQPAKVDAHR
jgi:hypothetical protein